MKVVKTIILVLVAFTTTESFAQNDVIANVRSALRAGSARELVRYCGDVVAIKINGQNSNYSRTQAEFILKDFFKKNEVTGFEYDFDPGKSRQGLRYAVGQMTNVNGSYRVYILFKKAGDNLAIDTLDFTKE